MWREQPPNLLSVTLDPEGLRPFVVNWDEVAGWLVVRLQREVAFVPGDGELAALLEGALALPDVAEAARGTSLASAPRLVVPLHLKREGLELRLFSTITSIGTPQDVTVQELRIESFMPADAASDAALRAAGGGRLSAQRPPAAPRGRTPRGC